MVAVPDVAEEVAASEVAATNPEIIKIIKGPRTIRTGVPDTAPTHPIPSVTAISDTAAKLGTVWRHRHARGCRGSPQNENLTSLEIIKIRQALQTCFPAYLQWKYIDQNIL